MFSYDPSNRILKVQKLAEEEVDLGLLEYQKESYQKYLTETIYSDMEYLLQVMRELLQVSQVDAEFRVGDLYCGNYKNEVKKKSPSYYPVYAKFTIDGAVFPNEVEVFRIPAMDEDGILNFNGDRRVLLMQMVAAERVSYAADKQTVSITTPRRNISLMFDGTKDVTIKYGPRNKIPMHKLIRAYNAKEKVYDDPSKLFTSAYILSAFATDSAATDEAIEDELDKLNIYATYIQRIVDLINESRSAVDQFETFSGHCFRHTYATRAFEADVDPKVVQKQLGHATLKMTMDLYTHLFEDKKLEELTKLDAHSEDVFTSSDSLKEQRYRETLNPKVVPISEVV